MPLYEVNCEKCRVVTTELCSYEARNYLKCNTCSTPLKPLMSTISCYDIKGDNSASQPTNYSKRKPKK